MIRTQHTHSPQPVNVLREAFQQQLEEIRQQDNGPQDLDSRPGFLRSSAGESVVFDDRSVHQRLEHTNKPSEYLKQVMLERPDGEQVLIEERSQGDKYTASVLRGQGTEVREETIRASGETGQELGYLVSTGFQERFQPAPPAAPKASLPDELRYGFYS